MLDETMSSADYHGFRDAVSFHRLLLFDPQAGGSPQLYRQAARDGFASAQTEAMKLGTAVHARALEGEAVYAQRYAVAEPGVTLGSKEGKAFSAQAVAAGKIPLTVTADAQIRNDARAVHAHPLVQSWMQTGKPEVSCRVRDPGTGLLLQVRFDWLDLNPGQGVLARFFDLKRTSDSMRDLVPLIRRFHYDRCVAWYRFVLSLELQVAFDDPALESYLVFVSDDPATAGARPVALSESRLYQAHVQNQQALATLADCMALDVWPDVDHDLLVVA